MRCEGPPAKAALLAFEDLFYTAHARRVLGPDKRAVELAEFELQRSRYPGCPMIWGAAFAGMSGS